MQGVKGYKVTWTDENDQEQERVFGSDPVQTVAAENLRTSLAVQHREGVLSKAERFPTNIDMVIIRDIGLPQPTNLNQDSGKKPHRRG